MKIKKSIITYCTMLGMMTFSVLAQSPTAAQIAQFQKLPKAQQEALARQMGIDLSSLDVSTNSSSSATVESVQAPIKTMSPKDTMASTEDTSSTNDDSSTLQPFGYDVLSGNGFEFNAVDNLPVPNDYVMGPGDEINVELYGKTSERYTLKINRQGNVNFPAFGPVFVSGETFSQLRSHIKQIVEQKMIGVDVVVTMGEMRSMQIYIVGEAVQPGAYNVNGLTTITQALVASGGIKHSGSLRNIQLKRKGHIVAHLDLYDLLLNGNTASDVRLLAGDTLFIPTTMSTASINGEVLRPAIYEIKNKTTIAKLLDLAGGMKPTAYLSLVNVSRTTNTGTQLYTLDLSNKSDLDFNVLNGDKVELIAAPSDLKNTIALRGQVLRQGSQNFVDGMKISDIIQSIKDDLKPNADLDYALVVRENSNREISVLQFSIKKAIGNANSSDNLVLQSGDQIFIFDNGIELSYWYDNESNMPSSSSKNKRAEPDEQPVYEQQVNKLDNDTGAIVELSDQNRIQVQDMDETSKGENAQQSSREKLLEPIIERLKSQSNYEHPAKLVTVSGAVKFPGTYPYAENQTIAQVILAAGGLTERAYLASAEITRLLIDGVNMTTKHYSFDLDAELNGQSSNVSIMAQDHLWIKPQPNWQKGLEVELQGEVMFPGTYLFQRGDSLSDIIKRAGGLTEFAYIDGAVFSRESLKRQEQNRLKLLNVQLKQEIASLALRRQNSSASYTSSPAEAMQVADELSQTEAMGRLVIDLEEALQGNDFADILLEKGDKLYIPPKNPTISIMGEVQYVSNHTFQPELSIEDYIRLAGGTKQQADTDRIYVVRADGSVMMPNNSFWFSRQDSPLAPGDTIIVPIDTDYLDGLSTLTSATQILYQIGVAWSAVKD